MTNTRSITLRIRALLCYLLLCSVMAGPSFAYAATDTLTGGSLNGASEFLPVEDAFKISALPTNGGVTLIWTIAPEYYLYKHRFKVSYEGMDITDTVYFAEGTKKTDDYFGRVEVYFYQAIAEVPLAEAKSCLSGDGDCDIELMVQYQGCAEAGLCYPIQKTAVRINHSTL